MMQLQDDVIAFANEYLPRFKVRTASFKDLIGQSDNSDATITGQIGEFQSSSVATGSAVALTSTLVSNITSLTLPEGDWDVYGTAYFKGGATTTLSSMGAGFSTTSATADTTNGRIAYESDTARTRFANGDVSLAVGPARFGLAASTTIYFVALAIFLVSTCSAYGIIQARRRRHFPG